MRSAADPLAKPPAAAFRRLFARQARITDECGAATKSDLREAAWTGHHHRGRAGRLSSAQLPFDAAAERAFATRRARRERSAS